MKTIFKAAALLVLIFINYSLAEDAIGYDNCDMNTNGEALVIAQYIKTGDIVFDVGANIGDWSRQVLSKANIILFAFEPVPATYELLKENIKGHNVHTLNLGLSNEVAVRDFFYYSQNLNYSQLSGLYYRPILHTLFNIIPEKIAIQTTTLDKFCSEHLISHIDFLKIDTEGAELEIFNGAQHMLEQNLIKVIQFEYGGCNKDSNTTLHQLYTLLGSYGYNVYRIVPNGLMLLSEWYSEYENFRYSNYMAILK